MATLKALAFDPGITTGIATGMIDGRAGYMEVGSTQEKYEVDELWEFLCKQVPDFIIYETFEFRNRAREGLELFSRELIGIIRMYSRRYLPKHTYDQSAYQGKGGYFTNKMLKEYNVYKPGMDHAMDATRHLCQWYTFGPGYAYNTKGFGPA